LPVANTERSNGVFIRPHGEADVVG
jgi:hypothetical protein